MKKVFKLILITILALSPLMAQARTLNADEVKFDLIQQMTEDYKKYTDAELKITVIALPFQNLYLPDGKISMIISSSTDKFMPRDLKKVSVYVNEKLIKTFNVPVEIKAYKEVLVASQAIDREKLVNPSMITVKKVEISNRLDYALAPDMKNKEIITKKPFKEGEPFDKRFVKLKPDVQKNATVTAYFSSDNLMVEIDAIALSDGMLGDYIGVENKSYKKVYTGKIIGENKVLIQI